MRYPSATTVEEDRYIGTSFIFMFQHFRVFPWDDRYLLSRFVAIGSGPVEFKFADQSHDPCCAYNRDVLRTNLRSMLWLPLGSRLLPCPEALT
jgi:hypothetical protein